MSNAGLIAIQVGVPVFLFPLYLANRGAARPEFMALPVVLAGVVSDYFVFFTLMMAICLLGLLPTVLLVLLRRKDIVRGLVAGGSRGDLDADAAAWKDPRGDSIRADRLRGLTLRARVEDRRTTTAPA